MGLLYGILYLVAIVLFLVGSFGTWERPKVNLISLGLAFAFAPFMIEAFRTV